MRTPKLNEKLTISEDESFEMSSLWPKNTGLSHRVWISVNVNQRHPRPPTESGRAESEILALMTQSNSWPVGLPNCQPLSLGIYSDS